MLRTLAIAGASAALLAPAAGSAAAAPARSGSPLARALLTSRELWATIDVCSPADQPLTVGIRGSMPGDGQAHDRMYMSFRLQYMNAKTRRWVNLLGASSRFVGVGSGAAARQGGRSFELVPGRSTFKLRGVVEFQWRRGAHVLQSTSRPTTAGHRSVAGADPAGYSAPTCSIS